MASALGAALIGEWGRNRKSSYKAKGWLAQIRHLTATRGGSEAADAVGLDVTEGTLLAWLEWSHPDDRKPSPSNQRKIRQAYEYMAGSWDSASQTRRYEITGMIDSGDRIERRTLRIDARRGQWDQIRLRYLSGEMTDDEAEQMFVEDVIVEDIGEGSPPDHSAYAWGFPGTSYTIT